MMRIEPTDPPDCTPSESSMSDAGDTALIVEVDLHSTCEGATLTLSVPNLEQSIGKDDPQAPGCTKRTPNSVKLLNDGLHFANQCTTMEFALEKVMPDTTHRWCKWHVLKNAKEQLGPYYTKRSKFISELHKIIQHMLTVDEFEMTWKELIEAHGLHKHPYLTHIYETREKWAKPHFNGKFCAKMSSTQHSESANHMLKGYVPDSQQVTRCIYSSGNT
ncbi:hypothetical protein VPH35_122380 [Triticum aestivum]